MPKHCGVSDCRKPIYAGWATGGTSIKKGLAVCKTHLKKHGDPKDSFSLWDIVGVSKPVQEKVETRKVYSVKAIKYISKGDLECLKRRLN